MYAVYSEDTKELLFYKKKICFIEHFEKCWEELKDLHYQMFLWKQWLIGTNCNGAAYGFSLCISADCSKMLPSSNCHWIFFDN